ncbi:MAG TPA: glycoside hydrolase family 3 N-terminal domain-containing protein [Thermoanaerobaculia bacterium]|nr:glycoside hydrolase family 3 N-terminal domain-containing protein [Thermoanaerobaculia bacterium]
MRNVFAVAFILVSVAAHAQDRVEKLLARMTLEEKLGQLTQLVTGQPELAPALDKGLVGSILNSGGVEEINQMQRRLKIPLLVGYDVIHGYRTIFPIPLAMASSWDPQLAELSAGVAAREARSAGIRWTFAPMVDIARDARWGRIAEGAGEDPVLGSAMAAAYVRGFQNNGLLACAKHYAAYGAAEAGRDYNAAEMSEGTLREVYLPPFRAAVDAGVATLMSAFESVNGVPATANRRLLTDILRTEWKFKGFVVSDWEAVAELIDHGVASSKEEAARKAITAGVEMDMRDNNYSTLVAAVRQGRLSRAIVDRAVRRVLRIKDQAGLLDNPLTSAAGDVPLDRDAARRVAQQSIVLLKNENDLLPLPKTGRKIAVVGPLADSKKDMLGPWSAKGKAEECVTLRDVIQDSVAVGDADVIIAVLGETREMSGEAASRASIDLPGDQEKLLQSLVATGKPVVLIVMSGRPLAISWAAEHVPAIVQAWFLGTESGHALADVLFGDVNPSGKLPVTIPRATGQVPIYYNHLPTGRPPDPKNKYTSKYLDTEIGPLYPFGFGLTYTKFEYSDLKVTSRAASATVRNVGNRAGDEIVQMYIRDPVASVSRAVKELKGFQRVALGPGESKHIEFTITRRELQFWSNGRWVTEPGEFKVWIGPNSATGLEGNFVIAIP